MDGARLALIGFGEAGQAFVQGWQSESSAPSFAAFDVKTADGATAAAKKADYECFGVAGQESLADALSGARAVFSVVTADRAHEAAAAAAKVIAPGTLFFDCNSCAPGTKRKSEALIEAAGARYVDTAVMAPVHPGLHRTPLLLAGNHVDDALALVTGLGMKAKPVEGGTGAASAIKMTRSVMIKGLEALVLECVLAGRAAGVDDAVLASLDASFPGFDWKTKAAYMMERAMTHGVRRAAEMREVALTVDETGLSGDMARATVEWQQRTGDLKLRAEEIGQDYGALADALLSAMGVNARKA
ncbi:MAG: DUF1932 domain-containing protein [Notoacmeibacter sp.]|nr:DUF1932 domain-containing protein [Notoacmeibacter sp.]MCC0032490.1 DUF1932 domain-containing protein [Brucellaceae bacterium]